MQYSLVLQILGNFGQFQGLLKVKSVCIETQVQMEMDGR